MRQPHRSHLVSPALAAAAVAVLVGVPGSSGRAAPPPEPTPEAAPGVRVPVRNTQLANTVEPVEYGVPVRLEHHGFLRFRPELVLGGHVGTANSGVPRPIAATTGDDPDAATLAWASLRLRYRPTLHIGSMVAVSVGVDAPDNLVLGSTHENAGGLLMPPLNPGFAGLGDAQAPASAGRNGWRDGFRIRDAALRVRLFDFLDFEAGRGIDHFGLGLYRNDGGGLDADFGSVIDRIAVGLSLAGFRIEGAFEFTATGATTADVFPHERGADGQPKDLGMDDDATTWMVRAGQFPRSAAEIEARRVKLEDERAWAVDWALFTTITGQRFSSSEPLPDASVECAPDAPTSDGRAVQPYDCVRLFRRNAFLFRPGLWVKAELRPAIDERLRIELEAQGLFGEVGHVQRFFDDETDDSRVFQGLGAAAEVEWWRGRLGLGLDAGLATGDNGAYLGYVDGQNVNDPDDDAFAANADFRLNRNITSFHFNRDYRLDLILFRQVIGGVTNAAYIKPWVAFEALRTESMQLRVRLDVLYAAAMRPSGTPGGGEHWGLEVDARVEAAFADGFELQLASGVLVPFDALQDPLTGKLPTSAFATRLIMGWRF